jgi:deoxyribodipyrimidine photo-lyase
MINASHSLNIGDINNFNFLPDIRWDKKMEDDWEISEDGAWKRLRHFYQIGLKDYKNGRDCPSADNTSKMSPYLRWGMISSRAIWHETKNQNAPHKQEEAFLRELFWREFTHHLLYYFPDMRKDPLQDKFKNFPWKRQKDYKEAWQNGQTGYPIVDAAMRQLWQTGWMHNRMRMVVGSLLVKHLLQPWQDGEEWFWDCLVDADPSNNTAGWQWIGGCGADAAPYFRIFNPMTQGEKFNAYDYVRKYVPEIADLPDKYLMQPWEADSDLLEKHKIKLGETYPKPIIGHKEGRERALAAFEEIKN